MLAGTMSANISDDPASRVANNALPEVMTVARKRGFGRVCQLR